MKPTKDPTPAEIAAECLLIQLPWSPDETLKRLRSDLRPIVRTADRRLVAVVRKTPTTRLAWRCLSENFSPKNSGSATLANHAAFAPERVGVWAKNLVNGIVGMDGCCPCQRSIPIKTLCLWPSCRRLAVNE